MLEDDIDIIIVILLMLYCVSVQDFWEGYKFYCFGYYSHSEKYKKRFLSSKMGEKFTAFLVHVNGLSKFHWAHYHPHQGE